MGKTSKVVVCGYGATGKTAVLEQIIYGNHIIGTPTFSTIEDTYVALIETDRGVKEKLRFYDTGGLDAMKPELPKHLLNSADGFVLVYDVTNPDSYKCVEKVKKEIDRYSAGRKEGSIIVLANKLDLEEARQVETSVAQKWAHKEKVKLFEVTVKNRQSLMEGFIALASKLTQPPPKSTFSLSKKVKGVTSSSTTTDS